MPPSASKWCSMLLEDPNARVWDPHCGEPDRLALAALLLQQIRCYSDHKHGSSDSVWEGVAVQHCVGNRPSGSEL